MKLKNLGALLACGVIVTATVFSGCGNTDSATEGGAKETPPAEETSADGAQGNIELSSSQLYFNDTNSTVAFYAEGSDISGEVKLYDDGKNEIAAMKDDGSGEDEEAGDGIYTAAYDCADASQTGYYSKGFYAGSDGKISNTVTVQKCDAIKEASFDTIAAYNEEINGVEAGFTDADGFVLPEKTADAIKAVGDYAAKLKDEGKILDYSVSDYDVTYISLEGITIVYNPNLRDVDSASSEPDGDARPKIVTLQPCRTSNISDGTPAEALDIVDNSARRISSAFPDMFTLQYDFDDEDVNCLDVLAAFVPNSIIFWQGHGVWSERTHSCYLVTGIDASTYWTEQLYDTDLEDSLIITTKSNKIGMGFRYFKKYVKDVSDSFIYFATCNSLKNDDIANALLKKGASVVVGNTNTVYRGYNLAMLNRIIELMTSANPDTGAYYTISEAINIAKAEIGADDEAWYKANNNERGDDDSIARVLARGDTEYRLMTGEAPVADAPPVQEEIPAQENTPAQGDTAPQVGNIPLADGVYLTTFGAPSDDWPIGTTFAELKDGYLTLTARLATEDDFYDNPDNAYPMNTYRIPLANNFKVGWVTYASGDVVKVGNESYDYFNQIISEEDLRGAVMDLYIENGKLKMIAMHW